MEGGMNVPGIQAPKQNKTDANKTRGEGERLQEAEIT